MDAKRVSSGEYRDTISSLPDDLLTRILSLLPTKRAASTSLLSRRWRYLFPLMIRLWASQHHDDSDFVYPSEDKREREDIQEMFRVFVDNTLSGCVSLQKFSLRCRDDLHPTGSFYRWINKALQRGGVLDLDIRLKTPLVENPFPNPYKQVHLVPTTVFVNNSLVKLTLGEEFCLGNTLSVVVCLPRLKYLFIYTVWLRDEDLCELLTEGCPALEELYIHHKYIDDEEKKFKVSPGPFYISHHNINKLTVIYDDDHLQEPRRILSIDAPKLIHLSYSDFLTCDQTWANFSNTLLEAHLDLSFTRRVRKWYREEANCSEIINYICNVQTIYLSSSTVEVMYMCIDYWHNHGGFPLFKNLTTLLFESNRKENWDLLTILIEKSPKLEILVLKGVFGISSLGVNIGRNVVKVLEIHGYQGSLRELNQVKSFMRKMECLEELKVVISDGVDDKLQITRDILALPCCRISVL